MNTLKRLRVLCVDDEPAVLAGLALTLGRAYDVVSATSGAAGLKLLEGDTTIAIVVSDMRMPDMNGATFLARARDVAPNATRILLTGQSDLASAIAAVNDGQVFRFLTKPCRPANLLLAVAAAAEQHQQVALERSALHRQLRVPVAEQDRLTGLATRTHFGSMLEAAASETGEALAPLAIILVHLNRFSHINNLHGYATGDEVLRTVSRRLRHHCADALCVARWGGAEFAIAIRLNSVANHDLGAWATALMAVITQSTKLPDGTLQLTASIGTARMPQDSLQSEAALTYAGIALQYARLQGGGGTCQFQRDLVEQMERRHQLQMDLRTAIDSDSLYLHYQPIVHLPSRRVHALEALARWQHPVFGNVSPAEFIALAEANGDMPRLGQWVVRRACQEARQFVGSYCDRIAINVSMWQLLQEDFLSHLDESLRQTGMMPREIEIELTESVFSQKPERVLEVMSELRRRGVAISIDDFGTGYSSLSYLQRFPATVVKIDRSFTANLERGGNSIIQAALALGKSLSMTVVIEGVETDDALRQLQALGASIFQGYLFARPMAAAAIPEWFLGSGLLPVTDAADSPRKSLQEQQADLQKIVMAARETA
jgi:diguanylate cyclase (GGDEF)-like protein